MNLIDNAIKFRKPNNEPTIKIEAHPTTPAEIKINKALHPQLAYYRITISDNGIGFAPEYAERIFAIFQRLHGRSEYEGTGLGLAICRKIAENHGGSIEAKAQEGEGAQFVIYLPTPS
ncbi:MAG: ATP-binding protein [Spirosomataceae bacterium]